MEPASPPEEAALWYQYLFHNERGRRALERNRRGFARQLWSMWSPKWALRRRLPSRRSAASFDNPDFVDVVIHSYRHRYALVDGDPAYAAIEAKLAAQPPIRVPTIAIDGDSDGVNPGTAHHARKFEGFFERRVFAGAGHNLPQERPAEWAQAVIDVHEAAGAAGSSKARGPGGDFASRIRTFGVERAGINIAVSRRGCSAGCVVPAAAHAILDCAPGSRMQE